MSDTTAARGTTGSSDRSFSYTYAGWEYVPTGIPVRTEDEEIGAGISFASEASLRAVWLTPEEDEAWKDL
jgi:hypothetical protein